MKNRIFPGKPVFPNLPLYGIPIRWPYECKNRFDLGLHYSTLIFIDSSGTVWACGCCHDKHFFLAKKIFDVFSFLFRIWQVLFPPTAKCGREMRFNIRVTKHTQKSLSICLFVLFPLTPFSTQSKGGSCEWDSLPSFPKGPTCKVRFLWPPYTWVSNPATDLHDYLFVTGNRTLNLSVRRSTI